MLGNWNKFHYTRLIVILRQGTKAIRMCIVYFVLSEFVAVEVGSYVEGEVDGRDEA